MDSVRHALRIAVVIASLSLMIGYVWHAGRQPTGHGPASGNPPATTDAIATGSQPTALQLGSGQLLLSGSKSYSGPVITASGTLTLSTQPIMVFSSSKSALLTSSKSGIVTLIAPPTTAPATQPSRP